MEFETGRIWMISPANKRRYKVHTSISDSSNWSWTWISFWLSNFESEFYSTVLVCKIRFNSICTVARYTLTSPTGILEFQFSLHFYFMSNVKGAYLEANRFVFFFRVIFWIRKTYVATPSGLCLNRLFYLREPHVLEKNGSSLFSLILTIIYLINYISQHNSSWVI